MWRSSKNLIVNCVRFILRCSPHNLDIDDLDDIPDYDAEDVPVHFQPRTFGAQLAPRLRQNDLQHRPDAPGFRRHSPPEIVTKVRLALEEMVADRSTAASHGDELLLVDSHPRSASMENT